MEIDKKGFKKLFPHLSEELEIEENKVRITSPRSDLKNGNESYSEKIVGYIPTVNDFILRCDDVEQAEKIINYLEKRGKVSKKQSKKLIKQLKEKGLRSFGAKKGEDYYLKNG